jgi:hypothetical protein
VVVPGAVWLHSLTCREPALARSPQRLARWSGRRSSKIEVVMNRSTLRAAAKGGEKVDERASVPCR